ncbi:MAG: hypothetical protein JOZ81_22600 [Chloroflexi bacterium]|nr:hypothetical protein [Chloroflexota bacterium]
MRGANTTANTSNAGTKANRELHMQRVLKVNRRRRELGKDYVDFLKRVPCADCGVKYPPYVMDFDHVRGEKQINLSRLRNSRLGWAKLIAEVEKCEVVCANCHRMRTRLRKEGWRSIRRRRLAGAWVCGHTCTMTAPHW